MIKDEEALLSAEDVFSVAMISNDVSRIRACITSDWVLVTPERGPIPGEAVLGAIGNGILSHSAMVKQAHLVRVFGDFGFVTGRGQNSGLFRGEPINADEWITDVYRRVEGRWLCELTHLTPTDSEGV